MAGALLLDLDRTLVNVQLFTDYDAAWTDVATLLGDRPADLGLDTGWTSATRACMAVLGDLPAGDLWTAVDRTIAAHEQAGADRSVTMPGATQFVQVMAERPTAVVTLLPPDVARYVLDLHGLAIDVVVGRDPVVRPKPSGDGLRRALEILGEDAATAVMVGDSSWDAAAALDAGVRFVGVHAPRSEFAEVDPAAPVCDSLADVLLHVVR
jgi:phosphoglycolate phosphatase